MTDAENSTDSLGSGTFTAIPEAECRELLSVGLIGRIAFNGTSGIELLPLNYFYLEGNIYFRVDADSELGVLADGAGNVAFEVDYLDELVKQAWSVLAKGPVGEVTDETELEALRGERRLEPWALGNRQLFLRLEPVTLTGRKVKRNAR